MSSDKEELVDGLIEQAEELSDDIEEENYLYIVNNTIEGLNKLKDNMDSMESEQVKRLINDYKKVISNIDDIVR